MLSVALNIPEDCANVIERCPATPSARSRTNFDLLIILSFRFTARSPKLSLADRRLLRENPHALSPSFTRRKSDLHLHMAFFLLHSPLLLALNRKQRSRFVPCVIG